jgi:hypothetical protein
LAGAVGWWPAGRGSFVHGSVHGLSDLIQDSVVAHHFIPAAMYQFSAPGPCVLQAIAGRGAVFLNTPLLLLRTAPMRCRRLKALEAAALTALLLFWLCVFWLAAAQSASGAIGCWHASFVCVCGPISGEVVWRGGYWRGWLLLGVGASPSHTACCCHTPEEAVPYRRLGWCIR